MTNPNKPQRTFEIGQIVYVLPDKAEAIVPAIVVEELVHKKLDGNSVTWKIAIGPPSKKKIVGSDELSGEIYTSLDEIQRVMMVRLNMFVENLVAKAHQRTEAWYGKQLPPPVPTMPGGKIDPTALLDTIDGRENAEEFRATPGKRVSVIPEHALDAPKHSDGTVRVKAPTANQGPLRNAPMEDPDDPRSALRNRLIAMAQVPEEAEVPGEVSSSGSGDYILTEDGQRIPVKYNTNE